MYATLALYLLINMIKGQVQKNISTCFRDEQANEEKFDQFVFVDIDTTEKTFEQAQRICRDIDNGNIARISSSFEFNFADDFMKSNGFVEFFIWVGLQRPLDSELNILDPLDPTLFSFVDEVDNNTFYAEPLVFPWDKTQPNNFGGNQSCVTWSRFSAVSDNQNDVLPNTWNDEQCDDTSRILCRTTCTTVKPTLTPTISPTASRTSMPTTSPIKTITIAPTEEYDSTASINILDTAVIFFSVTITCSFLVICVLLIGIVKQKRELKLRKDELLSITNQVGFSYRDGL